MNETLIMPKGIDEPIDKASDWAGKATVGEMKLRLTSTTAKTAIYRRL